MAKLNHRITGLLAATFCAYHEDGTVNYDVIPSYVDHLRQNGVIGAFVNGSTGEGTSLSTSERKKMAEAWVRHSKGKLQEVIVHCGTSSLPESKELATHAASIGVTGVACIPPYYFKTIPIDGLVEFLAEVAACCPKTPFYYYHIPLLTNINHSAKDIFKAAKPRIPNLAGMKFTNADIKDACAVQKLSEQFQSLGGFDDLYLSYQVNGLGPGAVGAFYNFMPKVGVRLKEAFERGDLEAARMEQNRIQEAIAVNVKYAIGLVAREFMEFLDLGFDLGKPRLPLVPMKEEKKREMREELVELGFFEWIK